MKKEYTTETNRRRGESLAKWWASLTPEQLEEISIKRSLMARLIWAERDAKKRLAIGQNIAKGKSNAKG